MRERAAEKSAALSFLEERAGMAQEHHCLQDQKGTILCHRGKSLNVIADAIAFKHELVPLGGPNFDDSIGESPFGHFSSGCRKNAAQKGKKGR